MNRKFLICLPVFMLLFLSGHGDIRELNEIGIVVYTAIDKKEDQWLVSYQVVNPSTAARNSTGEAVKELLFLHSPLQGKRRNRLYKILI